MFKGFGKDSTGVRVGNWFWLIGGETYCLDFESNCGFFTGFFSKNKNSYLWNINKRKWITGPQYHKETKYIFHYTCPLALNSSAIIFIGLEKFDLAALTLAAQTNNFDSIDFINKNGSFIPKFTSIYNFDTKSWIDQDSLDFTMKGDLKFEFDYNPACAIEQRKNESR